MIKNEPTSKFVRVKCTNAKCKNEQIIFGKASKIIKCLLCGEPIASPTGGKVRIKAKVIEVLD